MIYKPTYTADNVREAIARRIKSACVAAEILESAIAMQLDLLAAYDDTAYALSLQHELRWLAAAALRLRAYVESADPYFADVTVVDL